MKIEWLGHAAFIITSQNGTKVLTDPYESEGPYGTIGHSPIKEKADIVTVSHSHSDHCHVPLHLEKEAQVVREKINKEIKGITIRSVGSFHDSLGGKQRGSNTIFIFEVDGIKIAHFGDLGHSLEDAALKELGPIDIALIPVGGVFTIDAKTADDIIKKLKPKITIPMHFKTPKVRLDIDEVDLFLQGKDNVQRLQSSEIEISPDMLSSGPSKIIVLKHSH